jgi:hypothetical protein
MDTHKVDTRKLIETDFCVMITVLKDEY